LIDKKGVIMTIDLVVNRTKKIESLLARMGAEGRGLHEKVTCIEEKLEAQEIKRIRFIASIRNKALHDDGFELTQDILNNFTEACDATDSYLLSIVEPKPNDSDRSEDFFEKFSNASPLGKVGVVAAAAGLVALVLFNS
jgi:hypothetical protein